MFKLFNIPFYTLGGVKFWQDIAWDNGWRVQKNLLCGSCRLLDSFNIRRARGDEASCLADMKRFIGFAECEQKDVDLVIFLGGIFHNRWNFGKMADVFKKSTEMSCFIVSYSPRFINSLQNVKNLRKMMDRLPLNVKRVNFVTVGIGALFLRRILNFPDSWKKRIEIGRIVMIAPPNKGLEMAERQRFNPVFRYVVGRAFSMILPQNSGKIPLLSKDLSFAIIAVDKKKGDKAGNNNDDGYVKISETMLEGVKEVIVFHRRHRSVLSGKDVIKACVHFIQTGHLFKSRKIAQIPPVFKQIMDKTKMQQNKISSEIKESGLASLIDNAKKTKQQ